MFKNIPGMFILLCVIVYSSLAVSATRALNAELLTVSSDGKKITFMDGAEKIKAKVSGSRTSIKINGKKSDRKNLKAGLKCDLEYEAGGKNEPSFLNCK